LIAPIASGTVIVISSVRMPPDTSASTIRSAVSAESARMTGTMPPSRRAASTSCFWRLEAIGYALLLSGI
jgi:hypothetical protein